MLKAVIFDFDGVIVDSERLHLRAFREVAAQFNIQITDDDYLGRYLGLTDREVFEILVEENNITDRPDELTTQKTDIFKHLAQTQAALIPGVTDFLNMLRDNDIPMAICSGALEDEIKLLLTSAKLADYFEVIVAADHVTKGKPDPQGFLLALEKLNKKIGTNITPPQCIVIEDSCWGLRAAKAAAMHPVAVTNTYTYDQLSLAEKIIDNLTALSIADLNALCR